MANGKKEAFKRQIGNGMGTGIVKKRLIPAE
jgi:hypothetical protein